LAARLGFNTPVQKTAAMRRATQLLFLLFYLVSSYATTQHRLSSVVHRIQRSSQSCVDGVAFEKATKERVRYTHFREAKKVGKEFPLAFDAAPNPTPATTTQEFIAHTTSITLQFDRNASPSRAPPLI
jgi:hypothetical protein